MQSVLLSRVTEELSKEEHVCEIPPREGACSVGRARPYAGHSDSIHVTRLQWLAVRELTVGPMGNDETWGDIKTLKISRSHPFIGWRK